MKRWKLNLSLFEGGAEGGAAPGADGGDGGEASEAEGQESGNTPPSPEERKAAFEKYKKEYGDLYAQDMEAAVSRGTRENKRMQKQLDSYSPLMELLGARYGVTSGKVEDVMTAINNDKAFFEAAALKEGLTVDQYRKMIQLQAQNRQLEEAQKQAQQVRQREQTWARWDAEAEQCRQKYPGFDMKAECQNEAFLRMLGAGVEVTTAYQALHHDELALLTAADTEKRTTKQISDTIRSGMSRPAENGMKNGAANQTTKKKPSEMTMKEIGDIARRVMEGEQITW